MTFALKDFSELKALLTATEERMLSNKKKDSVEQLPDHRKHPLQFLKTLYATLEVQINAETNAEKRAKMERDFSAKIYGAIFVIKADIKKGYLFDCLNDLWTPQGDQPNPEQLVTCYNAFQKHLNVMYINNDPRQGLNPDHPLQPTSLVTLTHYAQLSYKKHFKEYKQYITTLGRDTTSSVETSKFAYVLKTIPDSLTAHFAKYTVLKSTHAPSNPWDTLRLNIAQSISAVLGEKGVSIISKLNEPRKTQLQFIETFSAVLENIPNEQLDSAKKTAILTGVILMLRGQIAKSYGYSPLHADKFPVSRLHGRSLVHDRLTETIKAQTLSIADASLCLSAATKFIFYVTIGTIEDRKAFRAEHMFSAVRDLNLFEQLIFAQEMSQCCYTATLDASIKDLEARVAAAQPVAAGSSVASSLYGLFAAAKGLALAAATRKGAAASADAELSSDDDLTPPAKPPTPAELSDGHEDGPATAAAAAAAAP